MKAEINLENRARFLNTFLINGNQFILTDESYYDTSSPRDSMGHGIKDEGFIFTFDWFITPNAFRYGSGIFPFKFIEKSAVLLRPLSSITDEDAIQVARIVFDYYRSDKSLEIPITSTLKVNRIKNDVDIWFKDLLVNIHITTGTTSFVIDNKTFLAVPVDVHDYLRSKGYALPWMGLSVEEMVAAGWIKLLED